MTGLATSGLGHALFALLLSNLLGGAWTLLPRRHLHGAVVDVAASLAGSATTGLAGHLGQLGLLVLGRTLVGGRLILGVFLGRIVRAGVGVLDTLKMSAISLLDHAALLEPHGLGTDGLEDVDGRTAKGFARPAAGLETANMLGALALLVRFLLVAIDEAVGSDGAATRLAGLAAGMGHALLALNLATLLVALLGDRAHARLHISVQGLGGRPVGAVGLLVFLASHALGLATHGLAGLLCHLIHALLLGVSGRPRGRNYGSGLPLQRYITFCLS